jgi:LysM repeat protein
MNFLGMIFVMQKIKSSYMQRTLGVTVLLCWIIVSWAQADILNNREMVISYIDQYKYIAMSEMERSGVPASIKLAQAILESNAGRSYLAIHGNNHFGMKCGSSWKGKTVFRKDDDRNKKGKLIKSCFRAYENPEESFIAHSDFLKDPNKEYRYGFLFNIERTNYKAWARGLKKSGYATNPKYAHLVISIIESYQLQFYDLGNQLIVANQPTKKQNEDETMEAPVPPEPEIIPVKKAKKSKKNQSFFSGVSNSYRVYEKNKVAYIIADQGDNIEIIALELGISSTSLLEFNDHAFNIDQTLEKNTFVFLENKSNSLKGGKKYHYVREGENLTDIAQLYAISLEKLQKRNRIKKGYQPLTGQKVYLRGRLPKKATIKVTRQSRKKIDKPENLPDTEDIADREKHDMIQESEVIRPVENSVPAVVLPEQFYKAKTGDSLYGIGKKFKLSVAELMKLNNWHEAHILQVGDLVRIQ